MPIPWVGVSTFPDPGGAVIGRRRGARLEWLFYALALFCFFVTPKRLTGQSQAFDASPRQPGILRVVTWNLGTGVDAGTEGLRNQDIEHVVQVIRELDPDLAFFQELTGRHQLRKIAEQLGPEWTSELTRIDSGRPLGVLAQRGELSLQNGANLPRAQALEYHAESGLELACVGLHADPFSARNRNLTLGRASDYLRSFQAAKPTLLVGDFNLDLDLDKRHDLFSDDQYLDVETYNYLAKERLDAGLGSGPSAKPDRRIDYLFIVPSDFKVVQCAPYLNQRSPGMDHHPLAADLQPIR